VLRQFWNVETCKMNNCIKHSAVRSPGLCAICLIEERDQLRAIVEAFLEFNISPTFDAKASYTECKSRELRRLQELARNQLQL